MPEWHGSTMSTVPPWLIPSVPEIKEISFALAVQHSLIYRNRMQLTELGSGSMGVREIQVGRFGFQ